MNSISKNINRILAGIMAFVLFITGITVYSSAHSDDGTFPYAETGWTSTVTYEHIIAPGSPFENDLKSVFKTNSMQHIELHTKVKNKNTSSTALCIEPGQGLITDTEYTSANISTARAKKYYKGCIYFLRYCKSVNDNSEQRRVIAQLFAWQVHLRNKAIKENKSFKAKDIETSAFKNICIKILKDKYGYDDKGSSSMYSQAYRIILKEGENDSYADKINVVKWKASKGNPQVLITGENTPKPVDIKIVLYKKIDGAQGPLAGCKFAVYSDRNGSKIVRDKDGNDVKFETDAKGVGRSNILRYENIEDVPRELYVKETDAPTGLNLNTTVKKVEITDPKENVLNEYSVDFKNTPWKATSSVRKIDSMSKEPLEGAEFTLLEWSSSNNRFRPIKTVETGKDGKTEKINITYTEDNGGRFRFDETRAPKDHVSSNFSKEFKIDCNGQDFIFDVENSRENDRELYVYKMDSDFETPLDGVEFHLYQVINNVETDLGVIEQLPNSQGVYYKQNLLAGTTYRIRETKGLPYYWKEENTIEFTYQPGEKTHKEIIKNEPITGQIVVSKCDKETKEPLKDAMFEVWETDESGKIPDTDEKIKAAKTVTDSNTDTFPKFRGYYTTDENGEFTLGNVKQTQYFVLREIAAPEGYTYDTEQNYYFINNLKNIKVQRTNNNTDFTETVTVENEAKKVEIEIHKISSSTKRKEGLPLEGAEFTIYSVDKEFIGEELENFTASQGKEVGKFVTDKNGNIESRPFRLGKYVIVETKVPKNFLKCDNEYVELTEEMGEKYSIELVDAEFEPLIKIVKKDQATGQIIKQAGTTFKIKNKATGEYVKQEIDVFDENQELVKKYDTDEFVTDEDGICRVPETLTVGAYHIEEIKAPNGYMINKKGVDISVSTDVKYEIDADKLNPVIIVDFYDEELTGSIIINKKGEDLVGLNDGKFIYEPCMLQGAKFELKAAEDIYKADGETLVYKKNTVIGTNVTNEDGELRFNDLPLGKYKYKEIEAPNGYYLDSKEYEIEVVNDNQNQKTATVSAVVNNDRQKVNLVVYKKDKKTKELLAGAKFGIYAANDIVGRDGNIIVKKGDLIEEKITGDDGTASFGEEMDYPATDLILRELEAPKGYVTTKEEFEIEARIAPQTSPVIEREYVVYNDMTHVDISKKDITNQEELEGATLRVWYIDESGKDKTVDEWVSGKEAHVIRGLEVGREYTLSETIVAPGFVTADDVKFVPEDIEKQHVEMVDDVTKVEITKTDITTGSPVIGANLAIYDMEGNELDNWVTEENPHYIEKLPIGKYILKEIKAPTESGYVTADDVEFEILDTGEIQKVDMKDDYTKLLVSKKSLMDGSFVIGAGLELLDANGNIVEEWTTEESVKQFIKIPVGTYTLRESVVPKGFTKAEDIQIDVTDSPDEIEITMYDDVERTSLKIRKVDTDETERGLYKAQYTIYNKKGEEVEVLQTDEDGYATSAPLELDEYTIKETKAPDNYQISPKVYKADLTKYKGKVKEVVNVGNVDDKKIPKNRIYIETGDSNTMALYITLIIMILGALFMFGYGALKESEKK